MKSFSRGTAGFGLLVLRLAVALNLITLAGRVSTDSKAQFFPFVTMILGIALLIGFLTSISSYLAAATILSSTLLFGDLTAVSVATMTLLCLALVGPGGYSIDAIVWGPRTITFPRR